MARTQIFGEPRGISPRDARFMVTGEDGERDGLYLKECRGRRNLIAESIMPSDNGKKDVASLCRLGRFGTILIDPPWRFANRTGKVVPEHRRLHRYPTMTFEEITRLPVPQLALPRSHLYLWCPNALLWEGLSLMRAWGFEYKTNLVWYKVRKDGGPDGRGVGFYFRNVSELLLFGVKGKLRTLKPGRTQVNVLVTRKREHSRKPDEFYRIIEACSPGPYLELFARQRVPGWEQWGDQVDSYEGTFRVSSRRETRKSGAP